MMLTLLILEPMQPENDIDVYLRPLIDDLKILGHSIIMLYDRFKEEKFILKTMLFGIINDFAAYDNLSRYSIKGNMACPIFEDNIC